MTGPDNRALILSTVRAARVMWLALMAGVGIYAAIAWYLARGGMAAPGGEGAPRILLWVALAYMVASIFAAPVVERAIRQNATATVPAEVARAWQTEKIVGLAIREGAGLLGVTVALLLGSGPWAIVFGAGAIGTIFLTRPDEADLGRRLEGAP